MPITPEHLSALSAYERLWRSDAHVCEHWLQVDLLGLLSQLQSSTPPATTPPRR